MKFLFYNNLPKSLAHGVRALCAAESGIQHIDHLTDHCPGNTPDTVWIDGLPGRWCIVSLDRFTKARGQEREALRRRGHTVYVLDPQWSAHRFWMKAAQLVQWWPHILEHARSSGAGAYQVPWRCTAMRRLKAL